MPEALRVLLVDDQHLVRSGFRMILTGEPDIEVVGEAASGQEAVDVTGRLRPDVVLMDVEMPGLDGIEATRHIVERDLARVLILTTFDRDDYLFDGLAAGASGFLLKNADPEQLVEAIRAVGHGHALLAPEVTRRVIQQATAATADERRTTLPDPRRSAALDALTDREREVLVLVAAGLSNAEIAARLTLSPTTIKTHVSSVLAKLHLRDRVQAVVLAYQAGLVRADE